MRKAETNHLMRVLLESGEGISDLNFTAGKPPQIEMNGELCFPFVEPPLPELTPFMTEQIALNLIEGRHNLIRRLVSTGACDFAYAIPGLSRFRVNVFRQRGSYSIVLRRLATEIPTVDDLVMPPVVAQMADLREGLVLITGGPGCGKSTTMAALVQEINLKRPVHIVTLEDPIEFLHRHQMGTVNQRELGLDFDGYANGLKSALRQSPKVIVVGELHDRETVETALAATETGHLVLSTMQTIDAGQTIQRLVTMFPAAEQHRVRVRLGACLRYVVAQCLVPKTDGGRVAALEILSATYRAQELIRNGESEKRTFYDLLREGSKSGMQTFDQHLIALFEAGLISEETCRNYTSERAEVGHEIQRIGRASAEPAAEDAPDADGLRMDFTYGRRNRE